MDVVHANIKTLTENTVITAVKSAAAWCKMVNYSVIQHVFMVCQS